MTHLSNDEKETILTTALDNNMDTSSINITKELVHFGAIIRCIYGNRIDLLNKMIIVEPQVFYKYLNSIIYRCLKDNMYSMFYFFIEFMKKQNIKFSLDDVKIIVSTSNKDISELKIVTEKTNDSKTYFVTNKKKIIKNYFNKLIKIINNDNINYLIDFINTKAKYLDKMQVPKSDLLDDDNNLLLIKTLLNFNLITFVYSFEQIIQQLTEYNKIKCINYVKYIVHIEKQRRISNLITIMLKNNKCNYKKLKNLVTNVTNKYKLFTSLLFNQNLYKPFISKLIVEFNYDIPINDCYNVLKMNIEMWKSDKFIERVLQHIDLNCIDTNIINDILELSINQHNMNLSKKIINHVTNFNMINNISKFITKNNLVYDYVKNEIEKRNNYHYHNYFIELLNNVLVNKNNNFDFSKMKLLLNNDQIKYIIKIAFCCDHIIIINELVEQLGINYARNNMTFYMDIYPQSNCTKLLNFFFIKGIV